MSALMGGDALKQAAQAEMLKIRDKIDNRQNGFVGVFDKWFLRVMARFSAFDSARSWEESVQQEMKASPADANNLIWDFSRLQLYLDRQAQGRFVDYGRRTESGAHYTRRYGMEFGADVLLTAQGAPRLMEWRGVPLMKTVFDYAIYPMLLAELRPATIFEIGSGLGASAMWLADHLALFGIEGRVHSADLHPPACAHDRVAFRRGDCAAPPTLFDLQVMIDAPRPWLVIEDAHHNVLNVLDHFHDFLKPGDYLVVEDSEVKRDDLRVFMEAHAGLYMVDTWFTDYFGRNATCAGDSIFRRVR
ncbi:MAG: CmcI family methyltransferase [Bdellovibrionales bacterium]